MSRAAGKSAVRVRRGQESAVREQPVVNREQPPHLSQSGRLKGGERSASAEQDEARDGAGGGGCRADFAPAITSRYRDLKKSFLVVRPKSIVCVIQVPQACWMHFLWSLNICRDDLKPPHGLPACILLRGLICLCICWHTGVFLHESLVDSWNGRRNRWPERVQH